MSRSIVLAALALITIGTGCPTDKPDDTGEDTGELQDLDGDGWAGDDDCDDSDPAVHPDAEERCNGVDDDCDGEVDEDATDAAIFYADVDADGYGDPDTSALACEQADGWTTVDGDCDDNDDSIFPGADEYCDEADNDCDGEVDEDAIDADTLYGDEDEDGYGDPTQPVTSCEFPFGYVGDDSDCDDSDAAVHPGADESCNGIDDDCDGEVDEEDAVDAATWYADVDSDGYGDMASTTAACGQPSGFVGNDFDCDDGDAAVSPDADEICNGMDDDCDGTVDEDGAVDAPTWYADDDGDSYGDLADTFEACYSPSGYVSDSSDCDDTDSTINPAAAEVCDGVDNDCDGLVDPDDADDASTWYADADADGFGDASASLTSCVVPSGHVSDDTDCDDSDASAHPGATEYCDGVDTDCDGVLDEDDAVDTATWYLDADADGFGDAASGTAACTAPSDHVSDATDCDDSDGDINPDATELCDGVDNDCDGSTDEDDAADAATWYADTDADGYGDPSQSVTTCLLPSGHVADATDCDDTDAGTHPGADEYCDGVDTDCDGVLDEDDAADAGAWYADTDADGYGDASSSTSSCAQPTGTVADATDCDDTDSDVHPGADEYCDGIDSDCDGTLDEDDAADASTWYLDSDLDGYGDASDSTVACEEPSGYTDDGTDCDDSDIDVNPGASELCNGLDDDCDGVSDDGVLGTGGACAAEDCSEVLDDDPSAGDGWYELDLGSYYCDMSSDGGGWTLVGDAVTIWGTSYDTTYYNSEGFTWNEALFAYVSGSVTAHCYYPSSLTGCNNIGMQFGSESWGTPLNWGSSICGMSTTDYSAATSYIGGYDWTITRTESTDTIRVGTLEGISSCTTSDNPGTAYMDVLVRR
jgi:hypothetical protein